MPDRLRPETYMKAHRSRSEDDIKELVKRRVKIKKRLKAQKRKPKTAAEHSATGTSLDHVVQSNTARRQRQEMIRADLKHAKKKKKKKKKETKNPTKDLGLGKAALNVTRMKNRAKSQ